MQACRLTVPTRVSAALVRVFALFGGQIYRDSLRGMTQTHFATALSLFNAANLALSDSSLTIYIIQGAHTTGLLSKVVYSKRWATRPMRAVVFAHQLALHTRPSCPTSMLEPDCIMEFSTIPRTPLYPSICPRYSGPPFPSNSDQCDATGLRYGRAGKKDDSSDPASGPGPASLAFEGSLYKPKSAHHSHWQKQLR